MLGPEVESYKGNKIAMSLVVILGLGAAWLVYMAFTASPSDNLSRVLVLLILAVPALLFLWLNSVRVTLHSDGISYRSLLGEKEMRWDAVERFYYGATKRSVNFIPIGTYYHFKFMDGEGNKLRLGNRVERPGKLGPKLVELSYDALYKKLADRYNSGLELDCGAILVNRDAGIKVKRLFGSKQIPWNDVSSFAIQQGHFYVWRNGEKRTTGPSVRDVPNAFALQDFLKTVFKPRPAA